ncbi:MAG: hypothetical protein A3I08_01915 [Candidatus Andersenbacteria bacterium RIFCSPLOWO2_02_FULL_46_11]|nr:MAG: hypothetical protein A3I08_01915 [Candidatus Andersenbacteria bacterium RIFCSPLOWO2_02_FULL_46_11]
MDKTLTISQQHIQQRLDVFCKNQFPLHSRASLQKLIKEGAISVNSRTVKPGYLLHLNDIVSVNLTQSVRPELPPAELPVIPIIFEDQDIVVINKPAGLLVHTDALHEPSVAAWFAHRYPNLSVGEDNHRPGIVHRLDRDTSGVMVLAKSPLAFQQLKQQFKKHFAKKEYLALVFGKPGGDDGRINQAIIRSKRNPSRRTIVPKNKSSLFTGKMAITEWRIEKVLSNNFTLLRVSPLTGRTHQIRVHLHFIAHPIVGDHLYTFKRQQSPVGAKRQMLHAEQLTIKLPNGNRKSYRAPLPEDFTAVLQQLHYDYNPSTDTNQPVSFRTPSSFQAKHISKPSKQKY